MPQPLPPSPAHKRASGELGMSSHRLRARLLHRNRSQRRIRPPHLHLAGGRSPCSGTMQPAALRSTPRSARAGAPHRAPLLPRRQWRTRATPSSKDPPAAPADASSSSSSATTSSSGSGGKPDPAVPKKGFFKLADPNAEVYSKAGQEFDPKKKGGRYKPEFIWNTNWQEQLKIQEDLERQAKQYREQQAAGAGKAATGPGVISFSRMTSLDSMDVDLSAELLRARRSSGSATSTSAAAAPSSKAAGRPPAAAAPSSGKVGSAARSKALSPSYQFKDMPSRSEARKFQRSARVTTQGTSLAAVGTMSPEEEAEKAAAVAAERARYEALKREFQVWTLAAALVGGSIAYSVYSRDTAISYALGAAGGLLYLRLLGRSVDALGGDGGGGGAPRLLIPVILALGYNRWNQLYAGDYGVTLQLIPELLGFFTYKLAVVARQGMQVMQELSYGSELQQQEGGEQQQLQQQRSREELEKESMTLDRIFVKKATTGW